MTLRAIKGMWVAMTVPSTAVVIISNAITTVPGCRHRSLRDSRLLHWQGARDAQDGSSTLLRGCSLSDANLGPVLYRVMTLLHLFMLVMWWGFEVRWSQVTPTSWLCGLGRSLTLTHLRLLICKMEIIPTNGMGGKISDNKYEVPGSTWDVAGLQ